MARVVQGDTVNIHYKGTSQEGRIFASSYEGKPVQFTVGQGKVIPGIEEAVVGMNEGESKTVRLPSHKAYGERRDELVVTVDRKKVRQNEGLEVGKRIKFRKKDGAELDAKITKVSDSTITVDANHPLSGKDVDFEIEVVRIV